jgi:CDP-glycerol glycerophosphotransferase
VATRVAKLSVVVPFYNVEDYIEAALESIARQTLRDLEVIMVDDGSADGSTLIAKAYAARDARFCLVQQPNAGLGPARNTGVRHATGKYLAFADSDDVVDPYAYDLLTASLEETGSDIAAGGVKGFRPGGLWTSPLHVEPFRRTRLRTQVSEFPVLLQDRMIWNKVFRRSFWDAHDFEFPGALYEDCPVTVRAHVLASSVDILQDVVYYWRVRDGGALSITQRAREMQNIEERMDSVFNVTGFLAANAPALKPAYDLTSMKSDLATLVTAFELANEAERARIAELAGKFLRAVDPSVLKTIPSFRRLQFHLIQHGMLSELLDVLAYARRGQVGSTPVVRREGQEPRWCARYPFFQDPTRGIPDDVYDITGEMTLVACLERADWHGNKLRIEGFAYIRHLSSATPSECQISVSLHNRRMHRTIRLPVKRLQHPDVTARAGDGTVCYDWAGFVAEIDPRRLAMLRGIWRGANWEMAIRVTGSGMRREGPTTLIRSGSAQWPEGRWIADNVWLQPAPEHDARFVIRGQLVSAFVTACTAIGDVLEVEGWVTCPLPDGARLVASPRKGGVAAVEVPVERVASGVAGQSQRRGRHAFRARIPVDRLASPQDATNPIDQIIRAHDEFNWDVFIAPDKGSAMTRLAIAPATAGARLACGNREVTAFVTHFGYFSLLERTLRPVVTSVEWTGERHLVLRGNYSDPKAQPTELILRNVTSSRAHTLPLTWDGSDFTTEFDPARTSVLADTLPLTSGAWRLLARVGGSPVAVAVARQVLPSLSGYQRIGLHEVEAQPYHTDALQLHVRRCAAEDERGLYAQERLKTLYYPKAAVQPIRELAVFDSFGGRHYSCNPRAIYEELRRSHPDLECAWVSLDGQFTVPPDGTTVITVSSREYYEVLAQARYVITNDLLPSWFRRREGQTCLQTWHGTPLKRIGFDIGRPQFSNGLIYPDLLRESVASWDMLVSPNSFSTAIFRSAFRFDGEILESGYPRNDPLHHADREERAAAIRERLGLPAGKRIVLYAPTWRDNAVTDSGGARFDLKLDLPAMTAALGDDHILLMRLHTHMRNNSAVGGSDGFVFDVTSYPDITDLYLISDVLVTDYSSVMFDFAGTGRPMLFFTYDLASYDNVRGFYFDFEAEAPGPLLTGTSEVIEALRDISGVQRSYRDAYQAFGSKYCALDDGKASARVIQRLLADQ